MCWKVLALSLLTVAVAAPQAQGAATESDPKSGEATESKPDWKLDNERLRALDGSKSPWSGQFNATYSGSSLRHPFSAEAPNPGHTTPPPVVLMTGTFSGRYRFDPTLTAGLGTGLCTETPFQGPRHTRLADPYADVAKTFDFGLVRTRVDLSAKAWTNHQYRDVFGYRHGFSLYTDTFRQVDEHLTLGMTLNAYRNTFQEGNYDARQQVDAQFFVDPFLEYRFNRTFNFRTVYAATASHTRAIKDDWTFNHPEDFQMVGLGMAPSRDVYFYLYLKVYPFGSQPVTPDHTVFAFNTIVNLL